MLTLTVLAALVLAASEAPTDQFVGDKKSAEVKILKKAPVSSIRSSVVIRSGEEAAKAAPTKGSAEEETISLAKTLNIPTIDWKKQMVIVIFGGEKGTGGYSVEAKSLEVKDGKLIVHWKLNSPGADDIVAQVISYPAQTILVDRFEGEVVFDPAAKK